MADGTADTPVYDSIGRAYAVGRRTDARWAAQLRGAIGGARTVLNVGAGTGSYEPPDLHVVAVEPSQVMIDQRPADAAPVVRARAENLPIADRSFDLALAVLTIHHWGDWRAGVAELRRVSARQVLLVFDPEETKRFWLVEDYLPEAAELDAGRAPMMDELLAALGGASSAPLTVPADMEDGILAAHWQRPHGYLVANVRRCASSLAQLPGDVVARGMRRLERDLDDGTWERRHGHLRRLGELDVGYRIVVSPGS